MIIDLENIANKLTGALFPGDMDEVEKAKIEYGFSLTLGVLIGFVLTVLVSALLGSAYYAMLLMVPALALRFISGGAHCSAFDRCMLFTLLVFVPASVLVKFAANNYNPQGISVAYLILLILVLGYLLFKQQKAVPLVIGVNVIALLLGYAVSGKFMAGIMFSIALGQSIQAFMTTKLGAWFIERVDNAFRTVGI